MNLTRTPKNHPRPGQASVNLLSPSAFERMAARRLRHRFVAAGVVLVLGVAGAWAVQHLRVEEARQLLAVEKAETTRLTAETQALAPVRAYVTGVTVQKQTVQEAMAREIYFSEVLEGLENSTPSGAVLQTLAVTLAADAPGPAPAAGEGEEGEAEPAEAAAPVISPCPGPDPFNTRVVVGCVTLSGTASSRAEVGELVISLGKDKLFVEPFISTTTTAESAEVSFSGSVGLSEKVYSGRYAKLDALLAGKGTP
jgi:hypothetical protein